MCLNIWKENNCTDTEPYHKTGLFVLPKKCFTAQIPDMWLQAGFFLDSSRFGCSYLWLRLDEVDLVWKCIFF